MSHSDMKNYRDSLHHIVRPEDPSERLDATLVTLSDYEALYLYDAFVEYASYQAESLEEEQIALGYAEYVNMVVRKENRNRVYVYAHTEKARDVLLDALDGRSNHVDGLHSRITATVQDALHGEQ